MAAVKSDFDKGKISLEQGQLIKEWLNKTVGSCAKIVQNSERASIERAGGVAALRNVSAVVTKRREAALAKLSELSETQEGREAPMSLKTIRLAEEGSESTEVTSDMLEEFAENEGIDDLAEQLERIQESSGEDVVESEAHAQNS
jgi:hypothetical protein